MIMNCKATLGRGQAGGNEMNFSMNHAQVYLEGIGFL